MAYKIRITRSHNRILSNICADIAQVFFGAIVAGFVVISLDVVKLFVLVLELSLAVILWVLALYFAEKGKL